MNAAVRSIETTEATAVRILCVGTMVLGTYGAVTQSPNTIPYLFTVGTLAALLVRLRLTSMPPAITIALACLGIAHLAGGLVTVGDDVLYNAHVGWQAFQYDHLVHSAGIFLGTVVVWTQFLSYTSGEARGGRVLVVCVLAGLGLGAINETIEFLMTVAHSGAHVGGYANTGWDLVSNVAGGVVAGVYLARQR